VDCVIESGGRILIAQIPLEAMDLIVNPKTGKLMPRPESPDMPLIDILRLGVQCRTLFDFDNLKVCSYTSAKTFLPYKKTPQPPFSKLYINIHEIYIKVVGNSY